MIRKISIAGLAVIVIVLVGIISWQAGRNNVAVTTQITHEALSVTGRLTQELSKDISLPPPLVAEKEVPTAKLTRAGVILWTNGNRTKAELPALDESSALDAIATIRLKDMFAKQYFEHVSPTGDSVDKEATKNGYAYLRIGENIALGNFEDDKALVDAWMASPGHRANILQPRYTEIGVAVGQGVYEGHATWIGVQVFALPTSACPMASADLRATIDAERSQIDSLTQSAQTLRSQLDAQTPVTKTEVDAYNQIVDRYNAIVGQLDALIATAKTNIDEYNAQVQAQNACAQGG